MVCGIAVVVEREEERDVASTSSVSDTSHKAQLSFFAQNRGENVTAFHRLNR